jgi:hypothetical protein
MAVTITALLALLKSIWRMGVRQPALFLTAGIVALFGFVSGCTAIPTPARIALLAPFEGRYREVGYDALYAVRLALADAGTTHIELLPVDDGGTTESAAARARALSHDPQVVVVLALGYAATDPATLAALGDLPVLVAGGWGAQPVNEIVFILSSPRITDLLTIPPRIEITDAARLPGSITGGDVLALRRFADLRPSLADVSLLSSATLPEPAFAQRYRDSDPFAPQPGLLAPLTYDAARMVVEALASSGDRRDAATRTLANLSYTGLNGTIRFEDSYWAYAPVIDYAYDESGTLTPLDYIIE